MLSSALIALFSPTQAKSIYPDYQLLRGEVQAYGDWLAGCDNRGTCTLLGFPAAQPAGMRDPDIADMAIRITLSGPGDAAPVAELVPFGAVQVTTRPPRPFYLDVTYQVSEITQSHGFSRHELWTLEAESLIRQLAGGKRVQGMILSDEKPRVRLPYQEFPRVWRAVSARRAELLRQSAAEPPGELPDGSVMPPPGAHRRIPATELMVSGFAPIFGMKVCGVKVMRDMRRFRFAGGSELWSYRCGDSAMPPRSYWQVTPDVMPDTMIATTPLDLPEPRLGKVRAGTDGLENAVFDFDFGILRAYQYQPGHEDCGVMRAWGFTASGWQLLERREMPRCMGVEPSDWIRTHYTPSEGAGPDE